MTRHFLRLLLLLVLLPPAQGQPPPPDIRDAIDWPAFLARHDLVWETLPQQWQEGAFLGNGLLGTMIYQSGETALRFDAGRSDVGWRGNRIAIGRFELAAGVPLAAGTMRLDLWNAEASGSLVTKRASGQAAGTGQLSWRAFTHAEQLVNVVEVTAGKGAALPDFTFLHEPVADARKLHKQEPIPEQDRNPAPAAGGSGELQWLAQPFLGGGGYVVAWGRRDLPGQRRLFAWTIDHDAGAAPSHGAAAERVRQALAAGTEALAASHRAWWHSWWPKSFLSIPDTRLEGFYWVQMYKLASATRADRPAIDLMGPWFRSTPWPRIWWNLNIQLTYWPVYAANRLDLGESLVRMLECGAPNLVSNVPAQWQADSAGIGRTSWYDCRGGAGKEFGNLTWALHNVWLHYRHGGDEALLRDRLLPLLKRSAACMMHRLQPEPDGKLHFPTDISPEYPREAPDTNYNLTLLRWALQTLIAADARLGLRDPAAPGWRDTLARLAPYPVDEATGYLIGRGVPLAESHRHFSHLFMLYPLHLEDPESGAARPLLEKSLDHWIHFEGALQGYSFTGASAMSSWLRRRGPNAELLGQFIERFVKPNTMYLEAGPVIETPLAGAAAVHEILLQSWSMDPFGTHIRPFPAVPDSWRDATIHRMLAEGGFEVSALRRDGRTRWIQVTSLAGNPCRVAAGFDGAVAASGRRSFAAQTAPDRNGQPVTTVDLGKGESVLLYPAANPPAGGELAVAPVAAQEERRNWFGSRKDPPVKAGADGSFLLTAGGAILHGEKFVLNRRGEVPNIGGWTQEQAWVSWKIRVAQPGVFRARLAHASPRDAVPLRVSLEKDGSAIASAGVTLPRTGSFETFREVETGPLEVAAPGDYLLTIRPGDGKAPFVNIESVTLVPGGR